MTDATDAPDSMTALEQTIAGIDYPDADAVSAATIRQGRLTKPAGALGWLEELSIWACGVQGQCPPHDFQRIRLVIFAGDHGVANAGVSAYPAEVTAQMFRNFASGGAAANVIAAVAGAGVRLVDMAVDADTDEASSRHKVRRSSGSIDHEDALTSEQATQALQAGIAIADEEIDSGADLMIAGDMGIGNTTPAAVLVSILTDTEPVRVVGRGSGIDDAGWIRKCAAIRDARRRGWPLRDDPTALLAAVGGADFAAMTGFMLQAARRKTPILLDGVVVTAAALVAQNAAPRVVRWMQAGHRSVEPAHPIALAQLGLTPMLDLGMRLGEGSGALVAVPILRAAVRTLAEMATFEQAQVSEAPATAGTAVASTETAGDAVASTAVAGTAAAGTAVASTAVGETAGTATAVQAPDEDWTPVVNRTHSLSDDSLGDSAEDAAAEDAAGSAQHGAAQHGAADAINNTAGDPADEVSG